MSSNALFSTKVVVFFALIFAVTFWLLDGAPVPMWTVQAVKPDARIPTFAEAAAEARAEQEANPQTPEESRLDSAAQHIVAGTLIYRIQSCNRRTRIMIVTNVENYFELRSDHPGMTLRPRKLSLPSGDAVLNEQTIERLLQKVFRKGQLTLDEFSPQTRYALSKFVTAASTRKQEYYKNCQG